MTASTLDTRSVERSSQGSRRTLHIDFGDTFVDVGDSLTDNNTVMLAASEETLRTSHSKVFLIPRLRGLDPDQDDLFNMFREDVARGVVGLPRMGSFGVHGDVQRKSLRLVEEAKVFSKAVKADDAEVLMHLRLFE